MGQFIMFRDVDGLQTLRKLYLLFFGYFERIRIFFFVEYWIYDIIL